MEQNCLFCKIIAGEIPSECVYTDDNFYAFKDINPGAPTHILIVPRKHIARINEVQPEDTALIGNMILRANKIVEDENLVERGFRYVINCNEDGGQTVFHVHLHILGGRALHWPPG